MVDAWQKVEIIFDWVRDHVKYQFDEELKGALTALESGQGDCEELTSLFIAICRNNGIPARSVWIPGHCYPEFYLEDVTGKGHWYPCQIAGSRSFGSMPEYRPVLQKGDSFRIPGNPRPQRYVAETFKALRTLSHQVYSSSAVRQGWRIPLHRLSSNEGNRPVISLSLPPTRY